MAKRYTQEDLGVKDIYGGWRESAEAFGKILDANNKKIVAEADAVKKLREANAKGQKAIDAEIIARRELKKLTDKAQVTDKAQLKLIQQENNLREKLRQTKAGERDATIKLQAEIAKETAAKRKSAKESLNQLNAFQKLTKATNEAQMKFKTLAAQYGVNDKRTRAARREFEKLDVKLRSVNAAARDGRRDVGRYGKALQGLRGNAMRVAAVFGAGAGLFGVIRSGTSTIIEYEQAQANLASVLGTTIEGTKQLSEQQQQLGATTTFTAAEVAQLQTELAKLGFTQGQIQNMTESTLLLAEATGTELAEAASVAGGTLRGFGLEATDMAHTADVMAKAFSSSGLDMEKFKETMKTASPIAKATGVSLEVATAAAGKLADAQISGSKAGTDLKTIFSELVKDGKPFEESLNDISNQLNGASTKAEKLAIAEKLVGERSKGALLILAEQKDGLSELAVELQKSDGAAKDMADTQRNTLGGALKLLKSAFDGFILSMNEANGIGATLRKGIEFLANNLTTILSVLGKLTKAFVIFKTTMFALKMRQRAIEWRDYNKALKDGEKGLKGATKSAKAFGSALKGIGLSVAITLVLELASAWWDVATGAANAAKFQKLAAAAANKGNEQATKKVNNLLEIEKERINKIRQMKISREEEIKLIEEAKNKTKEQLEADIERIRQDKIAAQQAKETAKERRKAYFEASGGKNLSRGIAEIWRAWRWKR